ncbi:ribonuclease H-like domain-containing protein [Candidatus Bipolaricaulota bacterium]|nr:ribonuclease H-like domain-containing protein [Candidatus Bipolaricaulota bacterium]
MIDSAERPGISEIFPEAVADASGCIVLEQRVAFGPSFPAQEAAFSTLRSELRLLHGIGTQHSRQLKQEGYTSLDALLDHPRWRDASSSLLERWGNPPDPARIYETLTRWLPSSSSLFLNLLCLFAPEDLVFFDLETLGLSGSPVFLGAIGRFENDGFVVRQFLAPTPAEEVAVLERMNAELAAAHALLSFNGKSFDANVLRERCAYYEVPLPEVDVHVDLLHQARNALRDRVENCQLGTIEREILGIEREADLPSEQVPLYYTLYLETGSASVLLPIINHNRQDLISLAHLVQHLLERANAH